MYVIWLRKKENVNSGKALTELFRYALLSPLVYMIIYRIFGLVCGIVMGEQAVYYDIDVYSNVSDMLTDDWANISLLIISVPNVIYNICTVVLSVIKKRRDTV